MSLLTSTLVLLLTISVRSFAGCESPFGLYVPKRGLTSIIIKTDQTLEIRRTQGDELVTIYSGRFTNFDKMKVAERLNYENVINVKPFDAEQSYLCLHVSDNCFAMKVGICGYTLERYGGEPPNLDAKLYWKK